MFNRLNCLLGQFCCFVLLSFVKFLTGLKTYWYGCSIEPKQRIYFANHQSHADLVIIWGTLPSNIRKVTRPIAAKDYWDKNFMMRWISTHVFNVVYVERQGKSDQDPLAPIVECLANGQSIVIFPEGTRNLGSEVQKFKSGLYNLAQQFPEVELVPIWLNNIQRVMPKGKFLPVPINCYSIVGTPLKLEDNEQRLEFLARARQALVDLEKL